MSERKERKRKTSKTSKKNADEKEGEQKQRRVKKRGQGVEESIRREQNSTEIYVKQTPLVEYFRYEYGDEFKINAQAIAALAESLQGFIIQLIQATNLTAKRAKRKTARPRDLRVALGGVAPDLLSTRSARQRPRPSPGERKTERKRRASLSEQERHAENQRIRRAQRRAEGVENYESASDEESESSDEEYQPSGSEEEEQGAEPEEEKEEAEAEEPVSPGEEGEGAA